MKWILAIIGFYVWSQSRATGLSFADQAKRDLDALLGQINQVNPPMPVLPINPLRILGDSPGGASGGLAPAGNYKTSITKNFNLGGWRLR